jgi:hypothetical protein|nr:MAG TPA: hypothetical protein [Bacteriophage sp.]
MCQWTKQFAKIGIFFEIPKLYKDYLFDYHNFSITNVFVLINKVDTITLFVEGQNNHL